MAFLTPRLSVDTRWPSWSPTSLHRALLAEVTLLARHLRIGSTGTGPHALIGMVDIGRGRWINTLLIEPTAAHQSLETPSHSNTPGHPPAHSILDPNTIVNQNNVIVMEPSKIVNTLVIDPSPSDISTPSQKNLAIEPSDISTPSQKNHVTEPSDKILNTLVIEPSNSDISTPSQKNLVIAHGYGAGLGFFFRNYAALTHSGYKVYSIDWLGMANSSRSSFPSIAKTQSDEKIVQQTEDFFIDSLEEWRQKVGIEKFTLMGHSLGGYLSTCYALKHPSRVEKLLLVSPVGVPDAPPPDQKPKSYLRQMATSLWASNITPMAIVRSMGPLGPSLVRSYTSRRFAHLGPQELKDLDSYLFHITSQPGSGEYALSHLLLPGAYARISLKHRLSQLSMPTSFIYGDQDWMDHNHAVDIAHTMRNVKICVVGDSGHHLYLDNPDVFNNVILNELKNVPEMKVRGAEYVY